jgi:hypothetical protein
MASGQHAQLKFQCRIEVSPRQKPLRGIGSSFLGVFLLGQLGQQGQLGIGSGGQLGQSLI